MRFSTSRFFHNFFTYLFIVQQTNGLKYFLFWYSIRRFYSNFSIFHGYDTQASQSPWGKITRRVNLPRYDTPVSQSPDYDTRGESISPGYDTPGKSISRGMIHWWVHLHRVWKLFIKIKAFIAVGFTVQYAHLILVKTYQNLNRRCVNSRQFCSHH